MNIFLLIVFLIIIVLLITFKKNIKTNPFENEIDKSMVVDTCIKTDDDLHALYAPNIPMDPRSTFVIGKKYCSPFKEETQSTLTLPTLPPLLYDGIWKNKKSVCQNDENTFLETNRFYF